MGKQLGDYQNYLIDMRATIPISKQKSHSAVELTWRQGDTEIFRLSVYDMMLARFVSEHCFEGSLGFETGHWPGGKPFNEQLSWKQSIWIGFKTGSSDATRNKMGQGHT